jgi:hypothetical protein
MLHEFLDHTGSFVFVADVDWSTLNMHRKEYEHIQEFCRVSLVNDDDEPAEAFDRPKATFGRNV